MGCGYIGIYSVIHTYQTLDLLLLSCPRTTFSRVPILIQRHHALTRQPNIPSKYLDPYPTSLRRRIPWVFELITTMRFLGWHTPHSQPTTSAHLLRSCPPPTLTRSRFIKTSLLRVLAIGLIIDFLVWNIRVNDVGFHLPYLLLPAQQAATSTPTPPQIEFTLSFPAIAIYPSPPRLHLSSSPPGSASPSSKTHLTASCPSKSHFQNILSSLYHPPHPHTFTNPTSSPSTYHSLAPYC
ncbi:hypothetical protein BGX38DRAFT_650367 [Terfezia claveryi]|nr:hypothetical protein BGX38DRAFT_650367 [Terfezia claveryi]